MVQSKQKCGQLGIFTLIKANEVMNRPHARWLAFFFLSPSSVPPRTEHHISFFFLEGVQDLFLMRLKNRVRPTGSGTNLFLGHRFLWLMSPTPLHFWRYFSAFPSSPFHTSKPLLLCIFVRPRHPARFQTITILPAMNLAVFRPLSTWCVRLTLNWEGQVFPWLRRFAGCS